MEEVAASIKVLDLKSDWFRSTSGEILLWVVGDDAVLFVKRELLESRTPGHGVRLGRIRPSTFDFIAFGIERIDVVGLPGAAVHDVPNWWRSELGRAVVHVSDVSLVTVTTTESTTAIVREGDGAAAGVGMIEAADTLQQNLFLLLASTLEKLLVYTTCMILK